MSSSRFTGKSALVTGASSGIGRAVALALGREGARVLAVGRRKERLEAVVSDLAAAGATARLAVADVRDEAACGAIVAGAVEAFGGLDLLVNAAGIIAPGGIEQTTSAEWDRMMDSNLRSVFLLTRAATPELIRSRGAIVNLSSVASSRPYANLLGYCVSKAGVDMVTRCTALDLAPHGVRVNAVNPGVVVTELHTTGKAVPDYPAFLERSKSTHPIGRVGNVEEIAKLVLYLLSDDAGWVTGATYSIDGGRSLLSAR
jgi:NAD(P)-dependent dehydrogenase (short-subunit alcohol dehydrogenase family)